RSGRPAADRRGHDGRRREPPMTAAPAPITAGHPLVARAMRDAAARLDPLTRRVVAYHLGWTDADGRPAEAGGKALRPALALLSARAAGTPYETAPPGAVAVEFVPALALPHEHLRRGDWTRRHPPAASTAFGASAP